MFVIGTINPMFVVNIILIAILLWIIGVWVYYKIQRKRLGGELTEKAFEENMRKAQIVDLRERKDFDG